MNEELSPSEGLAAMISIAARIECNLACNHEYVLYMSRAKMCLIDQLADMEPW